MLYYVFVDGGRAPKKFHLDLAHAEKEAWRLLEKEQKQVSIYSLVATFTPKKKEVDDGLV